MALERGCALACPLLVYLCVCLIGAVSPCMYLTACCLFLYVSLPLLSSAAFIDEYRAPSEQEGLHHVWGFFTLPRKVSAVLFWPSTTVT